ncbi:hypothetical protein OROGR_027673 [Orobanche gracilis]
MDSEEIVVSSIRPGAKREYNMMMKAQSELISPVLPSRGGRVTRSQSSSSSSRGAVPSDGKINKKVKGYVYKKMENNKRKRLGEEDVEKLESIDVLGNCKGPKESLARVESNTGHDSRSLEAELDAVDMNKTEKLGSGSREEEDVGKLESFDVSDSDKLSKGDVVQVESNIRDDSTSLETELDTVDKSQTEKQGACSREAGSQTLCTDSPLPQVGGSDIDFNIRDDGKTTGGASDLECEGTSELDAVHKRETKKLEAGSREAVGQPFCTESPLPQVGGSHLDFIHEVERTMGRVSDIGCERTVEATNRMEVKPPRRYTQSNLKWQDEEMELGSGVGVGESGSAVTSITSPSKLEMKMSKKVELKRIPSRLKDLLETGLLEGLHVQYIHGSKRRRHPESGLQGVIKGTGILCSCVECKGREVVTPNTFETHANSGNKRPPEYIYLENGKSLRDVLNACKANQSESLALVIQKAIGRSNFTTAFCINCKELVPEAGAGRPMLLCDSCVMPNESDPSHTQSSNVAHWYCSYL